MNLPQSAALIVIDVQQAFLDPRWGERNNPGAEAKAAELLAAWRETRRPLFHVQHLSVMPGSPLRPGQPGCEHKPEVKPLPGETVITKSVNSAFIGTDLEARLRGQGIQTQHCVSTTTRMAGNLGFDAVVAADACAAHAQTGYDGRRHSAEEVHAVSLATLHGEFAEVAATADILKAL